MFPSFDVVGQALWLVLGIAWCAAMLRRGRSDLTEWRVAVGSERAAIGLLWLVTAGVALRTASLVYAIAARLWTA